MTSKELVKQALNKWRFPVLEESEHTIVSRYQMNFVHITSLNEEYNSIAVVITNLFTAENEHEEYIAVKACNVLNNRMMLVKFYLDGERNVIISIEFLYKTEEDVEDLLEMALDAVVSGKRRFISQYKETEVEESILQELNEQEDQNI